MSTTRELIAVAETEIEECKGFLLIRVAHAQFVPTLLEQARLDALKGLEDVLAGYKRGLEALQDGRERMQAQGLEAPESLERFFSEWEAVAEKIFDVYKESVMSRYKKTIGLK